MQAVDLCAAGTTTASEHHASPLPRQHHDQQQQDAPRPYDLTQHVIKTMGPAVDARTRLVLASLIRHLHDFARDVELTNDEWLAVVAFINALGAAWTPSCDEARRVCDILGLETLLVDIASKVANATATATVPAAPAPTSASILGPFWSPDAPFRPLGWSINQNPLAGGRPCRMHGTITDQLSGRPIAGAVVDIWQASANGKYDFQDPEHQTVNNLRGKFRADAAGRYALYCYHPTAYSLPTQRPAYRLLRLMDRSPMRPAHIHVMVTHPDFRTFTTQLYPRGDPWVTRDSVFAVKDDLVVDFKPLDGDAQAELELEYNVVLSPRSSSSSSSGS